MLLQHKLVYFKTIFKLFSIISILTFEPLVATKYWSWNQVLNNQESTMSACIVVSEIEAM